MTENNHNTIHVDRVVPAADIPLILVVRGEKDR